MGAVFAPIGGVSVADMRGFIAHSPPSCGAESAMRGEEVTG